MVKFVALSLIFVILIELIKLFFNKKAQTTKAPNSFNHSDGEITV